MCLCFIECEQAFVRFCVHVCEMKFYLPVFVRVTWSAITLAKHKHYNRQESSCSRALSFTCTPSSEVSVSLLSGMCTLLPFSSISWFKPLEHYIVEWFVQGTMKHLLSLFYERLKTKSIIALNSKSILWLKIV